MTYQKKNAQSFTQVICDYAKSRLEPPSCREIEDFMLKKFTHPRDKTKDLVRYCTKQGHLVSIKSEDNSGVNRYMPKEQAAVKKDRSEPAQQITKLLTETAENLKAAIKDIADPGETGILRQPSPSELTPLPDSANTQAIDEQMAEATAELEPILHTESETIASISCETLYWISANNRTLSDMKLISQWNGLVEFKSDGGHHVITDHIDPYNCKIIKANDLAEQTLKLTNVSRL